MTHVPGGKTGKTRRKYTQEQKARVLADVRRAWRDLQGSLFTASQAAAAKHGIYHSVVYSWARRSPLAHEPRPEREAGSAPKARAPEPIIEKSFDNRGRALRVREPSDHERALEARIAELEHLLALERAEKTVLQQALHIVNPSKVTVA